MQRSKIIGISRHRLMGDGEGVTTLVGFQGCPLRCRYCLNEQCLDNEREFRTVTPTELFAHVRIDELYFLATGGGVTFGGGEPCLQVDFIRSFRDICGQEWHIYLETSLNVPRENVEALLGVADGLIIDIKDMNADIYRAYTGTDNARVADNLRLIADEGRQADCLVRLPLIPGFNTEAYRHASRHQLEALGFNRFDLFTYTLRNHGKRKADM